MNSYLNEYLVLKQIWGLLPLGTNSWKLKDTLTNISETNMWPWAFFFQIYHSNFNHSHPLYSSSLIPTLIDTETNNKSP